MPYSVPPSCFSGIDPDGAVWLVASRRSSVDRPSASPASSVRACREHSNGRDSPCKPVSPRPSGSGPVVGRHSQPRLSSPRVSPAGPVCDDCRCRSSVGWNAGPLQSYCASFSFSVFYLLQEILLQVARIPSNHCKDNPFLRTSGPSLSENSMDDIDFILKYLSMGMAFSM